MKVLNVDVSIYRNAEINIEVKCDCGKRIYESDEVEDIYGYDDENDIVKGFELSCPDCGAIYIVEDCETIVRALPPDPIKVDRKNGQRFFWPKTMAKIEKMERKAQ